MGTREGQQVGVQPTAGTQPPQGAVTYGMGHFLNLAREQLTMTRLPSSPL